MSPVLVAIDWGSSSVRFALLDGAGRSLEARRSDEGALRTRGARYLDVLQSVAGDWLQRWPGIPVLLSGMVGSNAGWFQVPYIDCPASIGGLAAHLYPVPGDVLANAWIAPGVRGTAPTGLPDVMRGEEVQYFGAWSDASDDARVAVLPGTHSKWLHGTGRSISTFATAPTGELFALLCASGSLAMLLEDGAGEGGAAGNVAAEGGEQFDAGVRLARTAGGLMHHVFSIRAAIVLGQLSGRQGRQRLSGLLIGHEVADFAPLFPSGGSIAVTGEDALVSRYLRALAIHGRPAHAVSGMRAAADGALCIARTAGLVEHEE